VLECQKSKSLRKEGARNIKSNNCRNGAFNSEIKRPLCNIEGFIKKQGLLRNLLPLLPR
jgi:hypothetical protein